MTAVMEPAPPAPGDQKPPVQVNASPITCVRCGYNLTGATIGAVCPECGVAINASLGAGRQRTAGAAIACLVLGILSVAACPLLGLAAVPLYFVARNHVRSGTYSSSSMALATAGLVCGIIGCVVSLAYVAFFGLMASGSF